MTNEEVIHRLEQVMESIDSEPGVQSNQVAWAEADRLGLALDRVCIMLACIVRDMKRGAIK